MITCEIDIAERGRGRLVFAAAASRLSSDLPRAVGEFEVVVERLAFFEPRVIEHGVERLFSGPLGRWRR